MLKREDSYGITGVALENRLDIQQQIEFGESLEDAALWPIGVEADHVATKEPGSDLLDGGLFEVGREGGGPRHIGAAGQEITCGVSHSGQWRGWRIGDRG